MATKLQNIVQLSNELTMGLSSQRGVWQNYLLTAARVYKYPFHEQLLIYGQRPEATACASMNLWNSRMDRWINAGAKGIALLDDSGSRTKLKYVFDISDTHPRTSRSGTPHLWQMKVEQADAVLESLANSFGEAKDTGADFAEQIISICDQMASDNLPDYLEELVNVKEGSYLEELDELTISAHFHRLLANSIAFTVLTRCGVDAGRYLTDQDFEEILDFSTFDTISILGTATTAISKMMLLEIGRTVDHLEQEEKFAKAPDVPYAEAKERTERKIEKEGDTYEYDADLHNEGRNSVSRPDPARAGEPTSEQVRQDAQEVSERASRSNVQPTVAVREAGPASGGHRPAGQRDDGDAHHEDGGESGPDRATESSGSDEVGGIDEQHSEHSGGDRTAPSDSGVTESTSQKADSDQKLPPSFVEQSIPQQEDTFLRLGSHENSRPLTIVREDLSLGKEVQIGTKSYNIVSVDEAHVVLSETDAPLFNHTMKRQEFEQKLRENPLNDHLKQAKEDNAPVPGEPAAIEPPVDRGGEMLAQAMIGAEIYEKTGQSVIAFEEGNLEPINLHETKSEVLAPPTRKALVQKGNTICPEVNKAERYNYHITNDELGYGGAKAKFQANVIAIRTLQAIEAENRLATPEEQEILARYVGWGGLAQAFDSENPSWANEYTELKELLSEEEYTSARASTLNAHYTSPTVIRAMYQAIESMGFRTGNILEPSCGTGNFLGMVPESMAGSKLYGVELDSLTGRIARQLYQNADVSICGFEETKFPDSIFDVAVGNVPFGDYKVADKQYDKLNFSIHDYFFGATRS